MWRKSIVGLIIGEKIMKSLSVRLDFMWDDGDDVKEYVIHVPDKVSASDVNKALMQGHKYLCKEDEEDIYGTNGRNPETLMDFVCSKYLWRYREKTTNYDINLTLN